MKKFTKYIVLLCMALMACLSACIDDSLSDSPSHQPAFSTDTLDMGTVFTAEQTATHRFVVYNPNDKGINISNIVMTGDNARLFRLNVDGMSGREFRDIEIRANDSIYVFVSADLPENAEVLPYLVETDLNFMVNGRVSTVVVSAKGQNVRRLKAVSITEDTVLKPGTPFQITDSLVVDEGVTLTLEPGVTMLFHDNASLIVRGKLLSQGTSQAPVRLTGDRMGNVITDVSFDLMSRQWGGVLICPESKGNRLEFTDISNTSYGVIVYGDGQTADVDVSPSNSDNLCLTMINSRLRNSGDCTLTAIVATVAAYGCEMSDAANSLAYLCGGVHRFDLCTMANYYLFTAVRGASWTFGDYYADEDSDPVHAKALVTNCISYGRGGDVVPGDLSGLDIYFKHCLFKSAGTDDDNFIGSIWDTDPMFYTVREDYVFDYRLRPDSPAINAADQSLSDYAIEMDYYGEPRQGDLGAYTYCAPKE